MLWDPYLISFITFRTASMPFNNDSNNVLMKSSGIAKKAVLHASILDVTPDHDFSTIKFNWFLGESQIHIIQYLRRLCCYSTEDSSQKSTFCHFSSIYPFNRLWALANAMFLYHHLLFSAGFWALIQPWRPFRSLKQLRQELRRLQQSAKCWKILPFCLD